MLQLAENLNTSRLKMIIIAMERQPGAIHLGAIYQPLLPLRRQIDHFHGKFVYDAAEVNGISFRHDLPSVFEPSTLLYHTVFIFSIAIFRKCNIFLSVRHFLRHFTAVDNMPRKRYNKMRQANACRRMSNCCKKHSSSRPLSLCRSACTWNFRWGPQPPYSAYVGTAFLSPVPMRERKPYETD